MKFNYLKFRYFPVLALLLIMSCKTEFEKIRTSNEPALILKQANEYYEEDSYLKAQTLYDIVIPYYRGKVEAEDLFYKYANTYYELGDYILAAHYFQSFSNSFINSDKREEAAFMSAYSEYQLSPIPALDQSYTARAIESLQRYINTYPTSKRVELCNGLIDELRMKQEEKAYLEGKLYFNIKQYVSAVTSLENMLKDFPETKKAEELRFLILKASYLYASNSIYEKREERLLETLERYANFVKKYPRSKYRKKANQIKVDSKKILKILNNDKRHKS